MKIAILDLYDLPVEVGGGDKPGELMADWLTPALPEAGLSVIRVAQGAKIPAPDEFDGFVVSGSEKGVYDETPWMNPLRAFLLQVRDLQVPVFGICFGHQIMADTFGGKAEKADLGMVVGARAYAVQGQQLDTHVWHQDQVTTVPPGAQVVGGADYCPVGVLAYDFPAMSVQFHPEYDSGFLTWAINANRGPEMLPDVADPALTSIAAGNVDKALMVPEAAELFRRRRTAQ